MSEVECPTCTDSYERLGQHWVLSDCPYPKPTDHQKEVLTGLLMGDGSVNHHTQGNPYIEARMITEEYLAYIDGQFPVLGTGISLARTAMEGVQQNRGSGFSSDTYPENYSDLYRWKTRSNPHLKHFASWYFPGEKMWPSNIQLTPTVLKHWYCGDGSYHNHGSQNNISIALANERKHKPKVEKYFTDGPGVPISNWSEYEKGGVSHCQIQFTVDGTQTLFDYMGEPLPGFEYKWPKSYRE